MAKLPRGTIRCLPPLPAVARAVQVVEFEVVDVQTDRLGDPRPGAVEHLEQGASRVASSVRAPRRPISAWTPRPGPPWAAAWRALGRADRPAGSSADMPSRTANLWKPRTAITVRAAELAHSGWWSASPWRSGPELGDVLLGDRGDVGDPAPCRTPA